MTSFQCQTAVEEDSWALTTLRYVYMCMGVLSMPICATPVQSSGQRRSKESIRYPETAIIDGSETSCEWWEWTWVPLPTAQPSLKIHDLFFFFKLLFFFESESSKVAQGGLELSLPQPPICWGEQPMPGWGDSLVYVPHWARSSVKTTRVLVLNVPCITWQRTWE